MTVLDASGKAVTSGNVGTGFSVKTPQQQFTVLINGDVNKDGLISIYDLVYVKRHILKVATLDATAMKAADVKEDGAADVYDFLYLKRHILGVALISQPKGTEKIYGPEITPTPTPAPTNTPVPTETPTNTPVPTETPTSTPEPTETPSPTPAPTAPPDGNGEQGNGGQS